MGSSPVLPLKIVTVVFAIVTAILGCVSHFQSSWTKSVCFSTYLGSTCLTTYEICDLPGATKCPKIAMERYFVSMVIICCILSAMFLVIDLVGKQKDRTMKIIDAAYHVIAAVLLIIAAILYFVSAEQIQDLFAFNKNDLAGINFRRPEKLAAASLTLIQGILCAVTGGFIFKG